MAAIYSNGGNRWNILGFNFNKRDALSSVYKISMDKAYAKVAEVITQLMTRPGLIVFVITNPFFLKAMSDFILLKISYLPPGERENSGVHTL